MIQLLLLLLTLVSGVLLTPDVVGVRHLVGDPDYRAVRLRWEAFSRTGAARTLPPFQVRYCEMQSWGTQRCRNQDAPDLPEPDTNEVPGLINENTRHYSLDIKGLRMATTYSFEVRPKTTGREDRADDNANDNVIIIPTKGFSARATQCLPHASEIEVSTGPHFAGRITVEASDGERCTVDGETDSPRDTYVLHIDHKECGSFVNETTVATYVIVQENLPILTHSTRRFLVLCSYQPETLTVRAGLSLPTGHSHHHGAGHGSSAPVSQEQDFNSVRRSRQLRPLRLEAQNEDAPETNEEDNVTPLVLLSILTVIGVCGIILITYRWRRKISETAITDTESIASDISISTDMDDNASNHSSFSFSQPNALNRNISVHMITEIPKSKAETLC